MAIDGYRSIHGRIAGFTSSGGLASRDSSAYVQMWGDGMALTTTSTGGATLSNSGVSIIQSSATAATFLVAAPVLGVSKEIFIVSSASALTFGGTSTATVFMKIAAGTAGSTTLTLTDANLAGQAIILRGLSATQWGVVHGSTVIQA